MAFTTGFTQPQLAQLEANIALGVLSVDHNGKKTTFQSLTQMLDLRDRIKAELAAASGRRFADSGRGALHDPADDLLPVSA